jgi:hypothetical protein
MTRFPYTIIVPVWGAVHVARFLDWALPTWLSPRNLPLLASRGPIELIVLTSRNDFAAIEESSTATLLRGYCDLRLIEIDDLIPGGISTVTLTLAFTRGVNLALAAQGDRRLIFLNGDFLLSDGSLASIADRFDAGQELLLCSSVRVREELVSDEFLQRRRADGVMVLPGRDAVGIALGALHPTVLACRVDQPLLYSAHPNQFFWKPDDASLVLRAFLLFPLAVVARHSPGAAETYCDFGWIMTMAEQATVTIIDNTDELFIVEMAPTGQEIDFVRAGSAVNEDCAERMSSWMTEFSSAQASTPIIFRARDGSEAAIAQAVEASGHFVTELQQKFGALQPVRNHPYWLAGVASYLRNRRDRGVANVPAEISAEAALATPTIALRVRLRDVAKRVIMGTAGGRRPWHPYYYAERMLRRLGQLRPVGQVALLEYLAAKKSTEGTPIAAAEFNDWQTAERTVASLWEATKPNQVAHLIVVNDLYLNPGKLSVRERIAALAVVERKFHIRSVRTLMSRNEVEAVACNRQLVVDLSLSRPLQAIGVVLASIFALSRVLLANLLNWGDRESTGQSNILLLELKRNNEDLNKGIGEQSVA